MRAPLVHVTWQVIWVLVALAGCDNFGLFSGNGIGDGAGTDAATPDLTIAVDLAPPADFTGADLTALPPVDLAFVDLVNLDLSSVDQAMSDLSVIDQAKPPLDATIPDGAPVDQTQSPDLVILDFTVPPDLVVRDLTVPPDLVPPPDLAMLPAMCVNMKQDGGETDVDCGGNNMCLRCANGKKCGGAGDCASKLCNFGKCGPLNLSFANPVFYKVGASPFQLVAHDFNNDNKVDIAVANYRANTVSTLQNMGNNGAFAGAVNVNVGTGPGALCAIDYDNDKDLDLAVVNQNDGNNMNSVSVLRNQPAGTFTELITKVSVASGPIGIGCGEFNGMAGLDLVVAQFGGNQLQVLNGNGVGAFALGKTFATQQGPSQIAMVLLDGDAVPDLVVGNFTTLSFSAMLGTGMGFLGPSHNGVMARPGTLAAGRLDGDGFADVVVANVGFLSIFPGKGDGTFGASSQLMINNTFGVAVADFDLDQKADIVATSDANLPIYLGKGDGTFAAPVNLVPTASRFVVTADFNADGKVDIAVSTGSEAQNINSVVVFLNTSTN